MRLDQRAVPPRHRRTEDREHRRAHRGGDVHRPGIARQEEPALLEQAGKDDEVVGALQLRGADPPRRQTRVELLDESLVAGAAGEKHRRVHLARQHGGRFGESLDRPLLHFPSARRVHGEPGARGRRVRPRQLPDCGACRGARPFRHFEPPRLRAFRCRGPRKRPGREIEGALDQRQAVVGDVAAAVVRDDVGEQRPAAGLAKSDPPRDAGQRHQRVRSDVALEVDGEVVPPLAPADGTPDQRRSVNRPRRRARATARRASRRA